jgi:hypothetical protein
MSAIGPWDKHVFAQTRSGRATDCRERNVAGQNDQQAATHDLHTRQATSAESICIACQAENRKGDRAVPGYKSERSPARRVRQNAEAGSSGGWLPRTAQRGQNVL